MSYQNPQIVEFPGAEHQAVAGPDQFLSDEVWSHPFLKSAVVLDVESAHFCIEETGRRPVLEVALHGLGGLLGHWIVNPQCQISDIQQAWLDSKGLTRRRLEASNTLDEILPAILVELENRQLCGWNLREDLRNISLNTIDPTETYYSIENIVGGLSDLMAMFTIYDPSGPWHPYRPREKHKLFPREGNFRFRKLDAVFKRLAIPEFQKKRSHRAATDAERAFNVLAWMTANPPKPQEALIKISQSDGRYE